MTFWSRTVGRKLMDRFFLYDNKHLTLRFSDVFTTQHGDIEVNEAGKPKVVFIYLHTSLCANNKVKRNSNS